MENKLTQNIIDAQNAKNKIAKRKELINWMNATVKQHDVNIEKTLVFDYVSDEYGEHTKLTHYKPHKNKPEIYSTEIVHRYEFEDEEGGQIWITYKDKNGYNRDKKKKKNLKVVPENVEDFIIQELQIAEEVVKENWEIVQDAPPKKTNEDNNEDNNISQNETEEEKNRKILLEMRDKFGGKNV
jgi:hypothetical protein